MTISQNADSFALNGATSQIPDRSTWRVRRLEVFLGSILLGPVAVVSIAGRTPSIFCVDLVALFCIVAVLWKRLPTEDVKRSLFHGVWYWYLGYLLLVLLTVPMGVDPLRSIVGLKVRLMPFLMFSVISLLLRNRRQVMRFMTAVGLCGVAVAAMTIVIYTMEMHGYKGPFMPDPEDTKDIAQTTFGVSNYIGSILILTLPLIATFKLSGGVKTAAVRFGAFAISLVALLLTNSRGSVISLVAGLVLWMVFTLLFVPMKAVGRAKLLLSLGAIVALSVVSWEMLPDIITYSFAQRMNVLLADVQSGNLASNRASVWLPGLSHALDSPVIGIGIANQYEEMAKLGMDTSSHNLFLETILETGLAGLVLLTGMLTACLITVIRLSRTGTTEETRRIGLALLLGFLAGIINVCAEPSFWGAEYGYIFWSMVAGAYALKRFDIDSRQGALA